MLPGPRSPGAVWTGGGGGGAGTGGACSGVAEVAGRPPCWKEKAEGDRKWVPASLSSALLSPSHLHKEQAGGTGR